MGTCERYRRQCLEGSQHKEQERIGIKFHINSRKCNCFFTPDCIHLSILFSVRIAFSHSTYFSFYFVLQPGHWSSPIHLVYITWKRDWHCRVSIFAHWILWIGKYQRLPVYSSGQHHGSFRWCDQPTNQINYLFLFWGLLAPNSFSHIHYLSPSKTLSD